MTMMSVDMSIFAFSEMGSFIRSINRATFFLNHSINFMFPPQSQNSNFSLPHTKRAFITYEKVNVNTLQEYFFKYIVLNAAYCLDNLFGI